MYSPRWYGWVVVLGLSIFLAPLASAQTSGVVYYVATDGNDGWSGRLPAADNAKADGPFATITRARDAIRQLKSSGLLRDKVTVQIRGGVYYIPEPIALSPQDSGTQEHPISYVAYPGEKPVLCGGRKIEGLKPTNGKIRSVLLPEVKEGKWYFRQLFVDGERQIRARCPNLDPSDPCRKGFLYTDRGVGGFGTSVGCIHNPGDWMEYKVQVPADGDYRFWILYGALNKPFGNTHMGGRTVLIVDGGAPVPLMNLLDTGGWGVFKWSDCASVQLTKGVRLLRWQNVKGGGLNLVGYALTDDPAWRPATTTLPKPAEGKHVVVIQAADFLRHNGKQLATSTVPTEANKTAFCYAAGTFKPSWARSPGAEVHIFQSGSCRAFMEIVSIEKVDEEARKVTVGGKECVAPLQVGDRYFVENVFEELDSPGEWYLNKETGCLYYWPKEGFSDKSEVAAPVTGRILQFEGDAEGKEAVGYVRFAGLTIEDSDYSPDDGCVGYGMGNDGAVYLKEATGCAIEDCAFVNTGKYAVCLSGGGGHAVRGNEISYSAEGGVLLLGSGRNTISNNHIHHCGAVYKHIGGVILHGPGTDENVVSHNLIHDMSRYGVSLKNPGKRNVIEYNQVHRTNTETYDTGGIEVTQHDRDFRSGSVIRHNIVGDTIGYSSNGGKDLFCSWGIYLDSFAGGYTVTDNITYRNSRGGIMLQGGKDNRIENNIFVDSTISQMHISNFSSNSTGLVVERNIVYYTDPEADLVRAGKLSQDVIRCDYNLYFHAGGGELSVKGPGLTTFAAWREKGFDAHSIVADPLFVNPKGDDYSVRPDSPAFKLGFRAIDTTGIGLQKSKD